MTLHAEADIDFGRVVRLCSALIDISRLEV
jgi:hypothetical protein